MDNKNNIMPSAKQLRTVLIIMWSILGIYLIIKLMGENWFEIVCKNERFISVCEYLDNHFFVKYLIGTLTSFIVYTLLILSMLRQWFFTNKQLIPFLVWIPIQCLVKTIYEGNAIISFSFSFITGFIFPCILYYVEHNKVTCKFLLLNILLTNVFDITFQLFSLLIKNISIKIIDENTLISLIFILDVYIMEALYYLYVNKLHQEKQ